MAPAIIAAIISAASSIFGNLAASGAKTKKGAGIASGIGNSVANLATTIGGIRQQQQALDEQQEFNADQAQIARDWNERMDNTKYQRQVRDMQLAGVNPALAMNGGVTTQATSNAVAQQSDSGINALTSLMTSMANLKLQQQELQQNKELKSRELDIAQQNANTQAGVGEATAENQRVQAEATRIANKYADEKNKLAIEFSKHQIDYEKYLAEVARIDAEIKAATKDTEISIKAQELSNMQTMQSVYLAQIAELGARKDLEVSEKQYTDSNKQLLDLIKANQTMQNTYTAYAMEHNLPVDEPLIVMSYKRADDCYKGWLEVGDKRQALGFKDIRDNIRDACDRVAQGKMTDKERTQFWTHEVRGFVGDIAKSTAMIAGASKFGSSKGASSVPLFGSGSSGGYSVSGY